MKLLNKPFVRSALVLCIVLGLVGFGLLALLRSQDARDSELAVARARWSAHAFSHYRLVIQEETRGGSCDQDVQIQDEQIQGVFQNGCVRLPSWTISNLFTWTEQLGDYKSRCYPTPTACVCHTIYTTRTVYDTQLGYPQTITYQWELEPNWGYFNHWKRLVQTGELPNCNNTTRNAGGHITITVLSLTPLP